MFSAGISLFIFEKMRKLCPSIPSHAIQSSDSSYYRTIDNKNKTLHAMRLFKKTSFVPIPKANPFTPAKVYTQTHLYVCFPCLTRSRTLSPLGLFTIPQYCLSTDPRSALDFFHPVSCLALPGATAMTFGQINLKLIIKPHKVLINIWKAKMLLLFPYNPIKTVHVFT